MRGTAVFSEDRLYRYQLKRDFEISSTAASRVTFILLNPSTADETQDDPTIRRCIGFAKRWGFRGLYVVNLFGLRSTDPRQLSNHPDPIGNENFHHLLGACVNSRLVIAAWGNHGRLMNQGETVAERLAHHCELKCLRIAKTGHPVHPLYLPSTLDPIAFRPRKWW